MYTEIAKFEFNKSLLQSARFSFLESIATALEESVSPNIETDNSGFSLELDRNGKAKVTIWHPWKRDIMWSQLRSGHQIGAIKVTLPRNFSDVFIGGNED
jgi:hypothetical protein